MFAISKKKIMKKPIFEEKRINKLKMFSFKN